MGESAAATKSVARLSAAAAAELARPPRSPAAARPSPTTVRTPASSSPVRPQNSPAEAPRIPWEGGAPLDRAPKSLSRRPVTKNMGSPVAKEEASTRNRTPGGKMGQYGPINYGPNPSPLAHDFLLGRIPVVQLPSGHEPTHAPGVSAPRAFKKYNDSFILLNCVYIYIPLPIHSLPLSLRLLFVFLKQAFSSSAIASVVGGRGG